VSQELERRQPPDIDVTFRVAKGFAMSGYFADAKSAEQAFVKVMAGAEMGLSPFQAMTGIHIIEGKPVVGAGLLAALVDQNPNYEYETEWEPDEKDPTACTVIIFKGGKERGRSRFSLEDAAAAGIDKPTRNGKPSNWKTFGRNMLFARAMSNAVRWYAPGITGTATYTDSDEIEADVLPPHIQALDEQPPAADPADTLVALAADILDATEITDAEDLPFEAAAPAPDEAESQLVTGQIAAEPAAEPPVGGGLLIDSVDAAARVIRAMSQPQLVALKTLLGVKGVITKTALATRLYDQKDGWYAEDIHRDLEGTA
jgi:hypothetical protein